MAKLDRGEGAGMAEFSPLDPPLSTTMSSSRNRHCAITQLDHCLADIWENDNRNPLAFWNEMQSLNRTSTPIAEDLVVSSSLTGLNPFTVIPDLTRHALTIVQREPRVNSGLAICVYSLTMYPE